jgi:hypothetical protein
MTHICPHTGDKYRNSEGYLHKDIEVICLDWDVKCGICYGLEADDAWYRETDRIHEPPESEDGEDIKCLS